MWRSVKSKWSREGWIYRWSVCAGYMTCKMDIWAKQDKNKASKTFLERTSHTQSTKLSYSKSNAGRMDWWNIKWNCIINPGERKTISKTRNLKESVWENVDIWPTKTSVQLLNLQSPPPQYPSIPLPHPPPAPPRRPVEPRPHHCKKIIGSAAEWHQAFNTICIVILIECNYFL